MRGAQKLDPVIAAVVGVAVVWLLLGTSGDLGYARDEGFYFDAARAYGLWFDELFEAPRAALDREVIDAAFQVNAEHPPLMKSLFWFSHRYLGERFFGDVGTGFRFPAMALAGLTAAVLYQWGARLRGPVAGLGAAAAYVLLPRVFYHAHLACFDAPIAAFFVLVLASYDRALRVRGTLWPVITGLLFGLAMATKHNAWFLPFVLVGHAASLWVGARRSGRDPRDAVGPTVACLVAMVALGPLVLVASWPWLWHDTGERWLAYARFHLEHEYYNMEFLGQNHHEPPFPRGYAPLMTLATVPTVTLLAAAAGLGGELARFARAWRDRSEDLCERFAAPVLFVGAILVSYAPWLSRGTPIFGGTKHWIQAYPFVALFAGLGIARAARTAHAWARRAAGSRWAGPGAEAVTLLACLAAPLAIALHAHPFALSAYVPLVGGAPGGASLGLNRTFWGYTTQSLAAWLDREAPHAGRVYIHDTAWPAWRMLQEDGRVRADLQAVRAVHDADIALFHHEQHMQGEAYQVWVAFGTVAPAVIAGPDGVPVIHAYVRTPAAGGRPPAEGGAGMR